VKIIFLWKVVENPDDEGHESDAVKSEGKWSRFISR
jgi:hypothetical protein